MAAYGRVVVLAIIVIYIKPIYADKTESGNDVDLKEKCEKKNCINKCCANNFVLDNDECVSGPKGFNIDFSDVDVYNNYDEKTGKSVKYVFQMEVVDKFNNLTAVTDSDYLKLRVTEDGNLRAERSFPNAFTRRILTNKDNFCLDYTVHNRTTLTPGYKIIFEEYDNTFYNLYVKTTALLISCVFLAAVLIVYCMLPELRTLGGKVLMACVASLLAAYASLATLLITYHTASPVERETCISFTCAIYFFFLASFFWMNVMSWDIWWSFRSHIKKRQNNVHGIYGIYSAYAWGSPLAMTVMFAVLNEYPVPGIITPNIPLFGCFIENHEKILYLYVPMLILNICNWILFLRTAFNIWRLNRATSVLDSKGAWSRTAQRNHRISFSLYLKLSVVMGISFVLELVETQVSGGFILYVTDMYNMMIGINIFLIFVGKKKILRKLMTNRFQSFRRGQTQTNEISTTTAITDGLRNDTLA